MNLNDVFMVRNHPVSLKLVLGLMQDADGPEETKSWALSALFHAGFTHDDSLRDYLHDELEKKGLHPYNEYKLEEGEQPKEEPTKEELDLQRMVFLSQLKTILDNLMQKKDDDGKPLFSQKNHWWAVFRIFVDRKIDGLREGRYQQFIHFIGTLKLNKLNAELDMSTLSNITQDPIFSLPYSKWKRPNNDSSRRQTAFDRMDQIASELLAMIQTAKL